MQCDKCGSQTGIGEPRMDPMFQELGYPAVQQMEMDSAGEWDIDSSEWTDLEQRLQFRSTRSCPDRKEINAIPERACQEIEIGMKAATRANGSPDSGICTNGARVGGVNGHQRTRWQPNGSKP